MSWANLYSDIFMCIPFQDGRTVANARAVCKKWKHSIEKHPKWIDYLTKHYIWCSNLDSVGSEIKRFHKYNRKDILKLMDNDSFHKCFNAILWTQHDINGYLLTFDILGFLPFLYDLKNYYKGSWTHDIYIVCHYRDEQYYDLMMHKKLTVLGELFPQTFYWKYIKYPKVFVTDHLTSYDTSILDIYYQYHKTDIYYKTEQTGKTYPGLCLCIKIKNDMGPNVDKITRKLQQMRRPLNKIETEITNRYLGLSDNNDDK